MSHGPLRVEPIGREAVLVAFAKLFAPRPRVYVMPDLKGWQYAAAEDPETHRVLIAVSEELMHHISAHVFEVSIHQVREHVDVVYVPGTCVRLCRPTPITASWWSTETTPGVVPPDVIELNPKPIAGA